MSGRIAGRVAGCGLAAALVLGLPAARAIEPLGAPFSGHTGAGGRVPQGYLGIDVRDVSEDQVTVLHLRDPRGAIIIRVDHDGPAGKMGLHERDVILQMNGASVDGEETMRRMLRETAPGHTVTLLVSRDGQQMTLSAQMADKDQVERDAWNNHLGGANGTVSSGAATSGLYGPQAPATGLPTGEVADQGAPPSGPPAAASRYGRSFLGTLLMSPSYTGALLEKMSPQLSGFFGVGDGQGLLVRSVEPDSPAAQAGMRAGDVVTRANLLPVKTMSEWAKVIKEAKGRPVTVTLMRDRAVKTVTLTPDGKRRSDLEVPNGLPEPKTEGGPQSQNAGLDEPLEGEVVAAPKRLR